MRRPVARHVEEIAGGERARHFTAKRPAGMLALNSGTPSFPTPTHVREAAKRALDEGLTGYALGQGDPEFLAAVCETVERAGASYSPDSVFATNGASPGIYAVFTAFFDRAGEGILLDPTFSRYAHAARQLAAVPVAVPHGADSHIDVDAVYLYCRYDSRLPAQEVRQRLWGAGAAIAKGMAIATEVFSHLD